MNWNPARYPGDAVRILALKRGNEIGDVRIQHYGESVRVATFLPGRDVFNPGDTYKTEPEKSAYYPSKGAGHRAADAVFDAYVEQAKADGWTLVAGRTDA